MHRIRCLILIISVWSAAEAFTKVNQCRPKSGLIEDAVDINLCKESPCKMPKKSTVKVSVLFTPETDVKKVRTHVTGELISVPLPFLGVDGNIVCDKIYSPDGSKQMSCPLKAGQQYLYKDEINILPVYPLIKVLVHWSLNDADTDQLITCFEIPAEIVRGK